MVLHKFSVTKQHAVFTVNRHHEFWPHCLSHYPNVFLRRMATDMNQATLFFDDVCSAFVDVADQFRDRAFVAGNNARGKHDCVAFFDRDSFVNLRRHLVEGGAWLGL